MSRGFLLAIAVVGLLHAYIGVRLLPNLQLGSLGIAVGVALLAASFVFVPLSMMARSWRQPLADRIAWLGFFCMGAFSSFFVFTLLRDISLLFASLIAPDRIHEFRSVSASAAVAIATAISLIGLVNARRRARVVHVEVPIDNLPEPFHGFTIAQISDVHVGHTIKRDYVAGIVTAVNALEADVIAVTGDIVDGSVRDLREHVEPFRALRARHGTYFVTGNHEYYSGELAWTRHFRELGMTILLNSHVVLRRDEAELVLAGVADYGAHHFNAAHRSDPSVALRGAPQNATRVLLAHQPRTASAAAQAGFDLQLSGHTHGGQFWPWNHFVRLQQPYTAGLHRLERLWIYISRGTGYWGPPKRFGAPSEITYLRLVRAAAP